MNWTCTRSCFHITNVERLRETVSRICNEITQTVESIFSSRTFTRMILAEESLRFHTVMMYILMITRSMGGIRFSRNSRFTSLSLVGSRKMCRWKAYIAGSLIISNPTFQSLTPSVERIRWANVTESVVHEISVTIASKNRSNEVASPKILYKKLINCQ